MRMKILLATLSLFAIATPSEKYQKPVNVNLAYNQPQKAINFSTGESAKSYVRVVDDAITYDELKFYAMYECKNRRPSEELIDSLIEIEKIYGPPPGMRGMILAAACQESGYNPSAKGDRKFSKSKKKPMAIGILQLWPIYEKMYPGLDRTNPQQSAEAWMNHIVKKIPKVKRQCKYRTQDRIWLAAWVTGIRYKKPGGRCKERPKHYRLLRKWHRQILEDRKTMNDYGCGC